MDPPHFFGEGRPPQHQPPLPPSSSAPKKQVQIQGPRPGVLKLHQDSHRIKKPPLPPQRQQPVIIYAVSPKVIHAEVSNFMSVVQRLTGLSSGDFSHSGAVSPAARLAATEKASPGGLIRPGVVTSSGDGSGGDIMDMVEGLDFGSFRGILSPTPAMIPSVPTGFFSPVASEPSPSFFDGMSPFFGGASSFMASPSAFLSNPLVSPLHSPDIFNLFRDL